MKVIFRNYTCACILADGLFHNCVGAATRPPIARPIAKLTCVQPAKKAQPASVTKTTIVTPAPRVSKSEASAKASPSPAAKAVPMFRDMAYQRVGMDAPNPLVPSTYAKAAPSASADAIDNEARALALRDEEKLYYSKKARPVAFKYGCVVVVVSFWVLHAYHGSAWIKL